MEHCHTTSTSLMAPLELEDRSESVRLQILSHTPVVLSTEVSVSPLDQNYRDQRGFQETAFHGVRGKLRFEHGT